MDEWLSLLTGLCGEHRIFKSPPIAVRKTAHTQLSTQNLPNSGSTCVLSDNALLKATNSHHSPHSLRVSSFFASPAAPTPPASLLSSPASLAIPADSTCLGPVGPAIPLTKPASILPSHQTSWPVWKSLHMQQFSCLFTFLTRLEAP